MELICANRHPQGISLQNIHSLCTSISKKQPSQIGAQDLNRLFSTEDRDSHEAHEKTASEVLENCESEVASPHTHHNSQPRKSMTINVGEGIEEKEPS